MNNWQDTYLDTVRAALAAPPTPYRNGFRHSVFAPPPMVLGPEDDGVLQARTVPERFAREEFRWMVLVREPYIQMADPAVARIWAPWADENGSIGPAYAQAFERLDAIIDAARAALAAGVADTGLVLSAWQHATLDAIEPPNIRPCHTVAWQFSINHHTDAIDAYTYQRSADLGVGVPSNVMFDVHVLNFVAASVGRARGKLTVQLGDAHLYDDQLEPARRMLAGDRTVTFPPARP
jgi:thymidylate synthase